MQCKALSRCSECGFCLDCFGNMPCPVTGMAHIEPKIGIAPCQKPKRVSNLGSHLEVKRGVIKTTMSGSSSKFHSTSSDSGRPGFSFGVDGTFNFSEKMGLTLILDSTQYRYSDSTKPDEMFFLGSGLKYYFPVGETVSLWTTAAFGLFENRLGKTDEVEGTSTLRAKNRESFGFGISPRAGADIKITESISIKAMLSFTNSKFIHNLEAKSSGVTVGSGSVEVNRSFFGGYIGLSGGF